jgi:predicted XRE-type DNA-binding protein
MDITQAAYEIAAILEQLEVDQKSIVASLEVQDTDISKLIDVIPQHKREVIIVMNKIPGSSWDKGSLPEFR